MYVHRRFEVHHFTEDLIRSLVPNFGYNGFGEFIFNRTYSRIKPDGGQENWADCVLRVTEGTFSIRKDWYLKNHINWDETYWQKYAKEFAFSMFHMLWLPPGRGLWAMGTDFVYERGAMPLQNCGFTELGDDLGSDIAWLMDSLMMGVGVGFEPIRNNKMKVYRPVGEFDYVIPDTREGWATSEQLLIDAYTKPDRKKPNFIYDLVRKAGEPIKGFGGISSGPEPLKKLHEKTVEQFENFGAKAEYDSVYLKTNLANMVGCCVVAGNVRRSAELAKGKINDPVFLDLKNYEKYPEREEFGWMSNNSVELETDEDFEHLGEIAKRVIRNGEPGYINRQNMRFGRIGRSMKGLRYDRAVGFNPCGEQPLENKEICCLVETLPTVCKSEEEWLNACKFATFYASTVTLLPTHQPETNKVIARNRRIGVGIIDYTGWKLDSGVHRVTKYLRKGYKEVRQTNRKLNAEAGIPEAIRVTTIKPGGTTPKLPGKTSGCGHPTFDYTLRRVRVAKNSPVHPILVRAGVPYEQDYFDSYTDVFEWPILQGPAKPADKVSLWEQAMNLTLLQREWSDNAVSNTLYFKPMWQLIENIDSNHEERLVSYLGEVEAHYVLINRPKIYLVPDRYLIKFKYSSIQVFEYNNDHEEDDIEPVLSAIAPLTKSVSMLPHSAKGAYRQMPEEGISKAEYERRLAKIKKINWSELKGSEGIDERYCSGPSCELPVEN